MRQSSPERPRRARYLFIVSREKPWLFDYLLERFADDPKVTVILDRRIAEPSRTQEGQPLIERHHSERRAQRGVEEDELASRGYFIVDL